MLKLIFSFFLFILVLRAVLSLLGVGLFRVSGKQTRGGSSGSGAFQNPGQAYQQNPFSRQAPPSAQRSTNTQQVEDIDFEEIK
jgi:hypothetical protein